MATPSDIQSNQLKFANNIRALETLQGARTVAQQTEATLRLGNSAQQAQADEVWERVLRLNTEIDILSGQILNTWSQEVSALIAQLTTIKTQLDTGLAQIKADQNTAAQVVQVLGLLDDVLAIAAKFLV